MITFLLIGNKHLTVDVLFVLYFWGRHYTIQRLYESLPNVDATISKGTKRTQSEINLNTYKVSFA